MATYEGKTIDLYRNREPSTVIFSWDPRDEGLGPPFKSYKLAI